MDKDISGDQLHRLLALELAAAGCFKLAPGRSVLFGTSILAAYGAAYWALLAAPAAGSRLLLLASLAFLNVQAGFLAHEAGHGALSRNRRAGRCIGQVFNTLLTALCHSHFQHIHRRHHPHCNVPTLDPDLESRFFSMHVESARSKTGLGRMISRHQAVLIWILVSLQGFTLKLDSLRHLLEHPRRTRMDQLMLGLHIGLWLVAPALVLGAAAAATNYAVMTFLIGPYLGAIFLVNHIGTQVPHPDAKQSFFHHELGVTRNVRTSRLHDFLFGGINHHIEHHLFPSIPTARLRTARCITRSFCLRHGLAYREMRWLDAAREVTVHFKTMASHVPA